MPLSPAASIRSVPGIGITPFVSTPHSARADTEGRSSLSPSPVVHSSPIPNAQSPKMALAPRMGTQTPRSQTTIAHPASDDSGSLPSSPAIAPTEQSEGTSSTALRSLRAQYDQLWFEVQDLRAERFIGEAPPSYAEGDIAAAETEPPV
jgi:hypothetical protein